MASDEDETARSRSPLSQALSALEHSPVTPQSAPRMFQPDEMVARRYRVVKFIARGGMGEVYEVDDGVLQQRVALKTIRADLADDETLLGRFHSEISLARRVTHRNVCRLFDVGFHDSPRGRITFLTMELCAGESLRQRLKRAGKLAPEEALPLVEQMAAGLGAAHDFGIIHRDFKSDNVMLVPQETGAPRVVITDFGLARSQDSASTLGRQSGELKGTPAYMAPEQLSNGPTGVPSDVYALGVVMYEMVTGQLPFSGDNPMLAAIKRLTIPPTPPRKLAPQLDRRWEQVILRCLERAPGDRFARVGDVATALRDRDLPIAQRPRRPILVIAATTLALALVATGLVWRARRHAAPARASFAAFNLANASARADTAWLATALPELLSAELATQGALSRVPAESVTALRRELALPDGELPPAALARVRAALHADFVLGGSYHDAGDGQLRIDVTLQDARSGATVASASESGSERALPELVAAAGSALRQRMGLGALSSSGAVEARAALPADPQTARLYAEGLAKLRRFDSPGARELLQQAVAADPDFPLGHAALADVFRRLGRRADEEREATLAWNHAASLPRDQQLLVEANLRVARREWQRAVELYRALYDFYPGSLDYGLRLAQVQTDAGQGKEALATLASLRRDVPAAAHDPRVEIAAARAAESLGDSRGEDTAAEAAVAEARALGAKELEAEALLDESLAALTLGDRARAAERASRSYALMTQTGNPFGVALALRIRGHVAWKASQLTDARALLLEAVAADEKLGDGDHLARSLNSLAGVESDLGHHAEAMRLYREALPLFAKAANRNGLATVHLNLGQQLHNTGDFAQSETEELSALSEARATGQHRTEAIALESLGALYMDRGELEKAVDSERQGVALATEIHDATTIAQTRAKLGVALGELGRVGPATEALTTAIHELEQLGELWRVGDAELRLGRLYLELDRRDEAEPLARRADERVQKAKVDSGQAAALLARVLVAAGKVGEARAAVDRALGHGSDELRVQAAAADVELAEHHPQLAMARLRRALATVTGGLPERFDAELVLARAELAGGHAREGRSRLRTLLDEARAKDFALVVRAASSLR